MSLVRLSAGLDSYTLDKQVQYQVVYVFVISCIVLTVSFAGIYYYLGLNVISSVMCISAIITFGVVYLLPFRVKADTLVHLVLIFLFIILIVANLYLGGFDNPNDVWLMVAPVIAGLLIKKQPVWFYSVLSLSIVLGFYLLKQIGVNFPISIGEPAADMISLANRLGAVFAMSLLVVLYRYEWNTKENQLKKNQRDLFKLANFDPLTKLANRSYFAKEFAASIKQADKLQKKVTMVFVDLDSFKIVNDTYGHNVGDELLVQVSKRFAQLFQNDDLLCRHGGDEFLIMMRPNSESQRTEDFSQKLIDSLHLPFQLKNHTAKVGCSIGIASYPEHGGNFIEVLRAADIAMYGAKSRGGEQFQTYNEQLSRKVEDTNRIAIDLRNAIESDQLQVQYQAKYSLSKNTIIGYESLLRWTMPDGKVISPDVFIKIAEEFSLINRLGDWALRVVCKQLQQWKIETNKRLSVAINISAIQMSKADFVESLIVITEHYGVIPEQLELELTENIFIDSSFKVLNKLQRLNALGFKLIIDDYGTGYASIGYLKKFPVAGLKIDRTFIKDILVNVEDQIIVESTISLAHKLGLKIIAEGVENAEQAKLLARLNCDIVQGYYFAKPLVASQLVLNDSVVTQEPAQVAEE